MFRRPDDDEDYGSTVVRAKPISEKYAKKLGSSYAGKDFVTGSSRTQNEFYGKQEITSGGAQQSTELSEDEKNKIHAKIMKAEMKGDKDLIQRLKRKLESGSSESGPKEKVVVMMTRDKSGNVVPASSKHRNDDRFSQSSSRMNREYGKSQDLDDMIREEKTGTSKDQLHLFERSLVKSAKIRRHDDESIDDIAEMQKGRKKADEKDKRKQEKEQRKEHKRLERSLDDCVRCIESSKLAKHCIVAVGINTYLAVVEWDGLDDQHLVIVPTGHCSSSIQLDENVWDEMRIWRKGLTAMWREEGKDCIFMEMSRNVNMNPHVIIECIPLPEEVGDTAPIYFKKAINECEGEYTDNKKLIEIKDLRRQVPKGFSYFAVDFGLQNGYAHVIENVDDFPATFGHEIIAGMLDLPPNKWRKKEKQDFSEVKKKRDLMKDIWGPFDWTTKIKRNE